MPEKMQNLVVLVEPSGWCANIWFKAANMCLNRFSIAEDASFELSGIYYFQNMPNNGESSSEREFKGTEYSFVNNTA